ncbi:hypothetical protein Bca4012_082689 [Brassica carinata]
MKAPVVMGTSSPEVSGEFRHVNVVTLLPQFSLRETRISQHDELQATAAISDFRSTFVLLIYLQTMLKLDSGTCLREKPAPIHDEAKPGTARSPPLSFFHTEIVVDSFTARRESLVGATMVNF